MKILLVHNQYAFGKSGEDSVLEAEFKLLAQKGHDVRRYVVSNKVLHLAPYWKKTLLGLQFIWSFTAYRELSDEISSFEPDVVHVHNIFALLSPSIFWATSRKRVPVVMTLHNYRLLCANSCLLRLSKPCQQCVGRTPIYALLRLCKYGNSFPAAASIVAMQFFHRCLGTFRTRVDAYVVLSKFAKSIMERGGLPAELLHTKPNFCHTPAGGMSNGKRKQQVIFVGSLDHTKGIDLLIDAWSALDPLGWRLLIIGDGADRTRIEMLARKHRRIDYLGTMTNENVLQVLAESRFLVLPSRWYEGFPMVIVEAYCAGTPVIVPEHGPFPEFVDNAQTGLLVQPNNVASLVNALAFVTAQDDEQWLSWSLASRQKYLRQYTPEINYEALMHIYEAAKQQVRIKRIR